MPSCEAGAAIGGFGDILSSVVSLPTVLALLAVFLSAMQGVLVLESTDPCRISGRKMNILLILEAAEVVVSLSSELLSFFELSQALETSLKWLYWVAPCLLAAGIIETLTNVYFTLAVVTKSRIGWMPFSATGGKNNIWELAPFSITLTFSMALVGWRLRWWWTGNCVEAEQAVAAVQNEIALRQGVMGFGVGWTLGISALVFVIVMFTDCSEDGAHYVAGMKYLWRPDEWIDDQHGDVKVWYRNNTGENIMQQYVATAVLNDDVDIVDTEDEVLLQLGKRPLHCGHAIVGKDRELIFAEDRNSSRLHKVILVAEHLVVLPLLVIMVVIVQRLHKSLDKDTFNAVQQLVDGVIILAFLEIAIGVKNVLWSISGTSQDERPGVSDKKRLRQLEEFSARNLQGKLVSSQEEL